jgi:hypothetical protein
MNKELTWNRRRFFDAAGKIGAGVVVGTCSGSIVLAHSKGAKEEKPYEIGPTEDLMREALARISARCLASDGFLTPRTSAKSLGGRVVSPIEEHAASISECRVL